MPRPLLIFDLDGTLIDSADGICSAVNRTRELIGFPSAEVDFLHQRIGLPATTLFDDLELTENQLADAVKIFRRHLLITIDEGVVFFPGALDFLRFAKSNEFFTAIATNKPITLANRLVSSCELSELIDLTIGVGDFLPKPDPSMISYCSEYFKSSDSIMFGDRVEDMQAARHAGAKAIGLVQGFHTKENLLGSGANQVFSDFVSVHQNFDLNVWGT